MFSIVFFLIFSVIVDASHNDSATLLSFKDGVGDPLGALSGWNTSVSCCEWEGVDCSRQENRVIGLRLQSLTLLSPNFLLLKVQNLSYLHELHISRSRFTEPLSNSSRLPSCGLEALDLSNNSLQGSFPTELLLNCKDSLRLLNLSHNQLRNELGDSNYVIGSILESINLSNNNFTGKISSSLFQSCNSLRSINLSSNRFEGSVPQEMVTRCPVLEHVDLASNNFSGALDFRSSNSIQRLNLASNSLSEVATTCLNVTHLDVSYNRISRKLFSSNSNSTCSSLKVLNISSNLFSGPLTSVLGLDSLELHSSLEALDGSYNNFTGEVPGFHANLKRLDLSSNMFSKTRNNICPTDSKLESLLLPNNRLAGPLFNLLVNCARLEMLDVSFNALTEEIPDQLCRNLPKLRHLFAWASDLHGSIPPTLADCTNLTFIILSHNNLNGSIPPQLSGLHKLWWLSLSSNNLSGKIPSSFGELDNLVCLQLKDNSLQGEIPREMDGSQNLRVIELASNSLTGKLPGKIGRKFAKVEDAEGLPVETRLGNVRVARPPGPLCRRENIVFATQGIRPADLEMLLFARTGCFAHLNIDAHYVFNISSPLIIDVSHNQLSGAIPEEIGQMHSLLVLNIDHNKLSGPIPAVLGSLKDMQVLDLSQNALTGGIPYSLSQLTFLFYFNVSYNNLSGPIPQNGQFLAFPATSYQGNPELCGLPLPTKCSAAGLPTFTHHPLSNSGIEDVLVVTLVSGFIASVVSCTLTLYCISKWEAGYLK